MCNQSSWNCNLKESLESFFFQMGESHMCNTFKTTPILWIPRAPPPSFLSQSYLNSQSFAASWALDIFPFSFPPKWPRLAELIGSVLSNRHHQSSHVINNVHFPRSPSAEWRQLVDACLPVFQLSVTQSSLDCHTILINLYVIVVCKLFCLWNLAYDTDLWDLLNCNFAPK